MKPNKDCYPAGGGVLPPVWGSSERQAYGHTDYLHKLALYAAELSWPEGKSR